MVNHTNMDSSNTSALEASASSSTGSCVFADTGLDPSSNGNEEGKPAGLSLGSPGQYVEGQNKLDTKNDQEFG